MCVWLQIKASDKHLENKHLANKIIKFIEENEKSHIATCHVWKVPNPTQTLNRQRGYSKCNKMNIEHSASFVDKGLPQVLTPKS
jgi:hypothetical protein